MDIAEKFSLADHGIDVVLFDHMLSNLEPEKLELLEKALDTVSWDRREFVGKSFKPFLRRFQNSVDTGRDTAMYKHASLGANALVHAAALTHMPSRMPLMGMTSYQSEVVLQRVIDKVFYYPPYVVSGFHRNDKFINSVCGAGAFVLAGDYALRQREELIRKGEAVREVPTVPQVEETILDAAA
jgi:hypothetical protein